MAPPRSAEKQPGARIDAVFAALRDQCRTALIPYLTAGDPDPEATLPIMLAMAAAGADVIELGVPFSDPMADGPVIQKASERALAKKVGLRRVLEIAAQFRARDPATPLVVMGYANPIERYGVEAFAAAAEAAGVDGVLVVDYPPEECAEFAAMLRRHGIAPIFLVAPTSSAGRIAALAKVASGYVYHVALKGVTGAGHFDIDAVQQMIPRIREHVKLPIGVGFGIRDGRTARQVGEVADAVIIGSALVQLLEGLDVDSAPQAAAGFVAEIRAALDAPGHGVAGRAMSGAPS
ncbi:MAG: tryptophan synthase subunit alpha [Pseudomonadota bacterium]|nr:tryptophan synthase subunit alpha [Pseudomonadota bacterium]